jgi:Protein of unknown function (DUF2946)
MGWFRGQRRVGAWLALVALAFQLGLAFGHVHHTATSHSTEFAAADRDGDHDDAGKHDCPTCAILKLLAGAAPGAPPVSAMPIQADAETIRPVIETIRSGQTRTAFRSRAPPLS